MLRCVDLIQEDDHALTLALLDKLSCLSKSLGWCGQAFYKSCETGSGEPQMNKCYLPHGHRLCLGQGPDRCRLLWSHHERSA